MNRLLCSEAASQQPTDSIIVSSAWAKRLKEGLILSLELVYLGLSVSQEALGLCSELGVGSGELLDQMECCLRH